jgi:hypothetical protein
MSDLGNLAKRWWKAKKTELLAGNKRDHDNAETEAGNAQRDLSDAAINEAARSMFPGLARHQDRQAAAAAQRVADERAAVLALPRSQVSMTVSGAVSGSWTGEMPIRVVRDPQERSLTVELTTPDDLAPLLAGQPLYGLLLLVPGYSGAGHYELGAGGDDFDPLDYQLLLGYREEPFYWTPDFGPALIDVAAGEKRLTVQMATQGAAGDLRLDATMTLPSATLPSASQPSATLP